MEIKTLQEFEALIAQLESGQTLKETVLRFEPNLLDDAALQKLVDTLIVGNWPPSLKIFSFNDSYLSHTGVQTLAKLLMSGVCPKGFELHLAGCDIDSSDATTLANTLTSGLCQTRSGLDLSGNSRMSDESKQALVDALNSPKSSPGLILKLDSGGPRLTRTVALTNAQLSGPSATLPQVSRKELYRLCRIGELPTFRGKAVVIEKIETSPPHYNFVEFGKSAPLLPEDLVNVPDLQDLLRYQFEYTAQQKAIIRIIQIALHNDDYWQTLTWDGRIPPSIIALRNQFKLSIASPKTLAQQLIELKQTAKQFLFNTSFPDSGSAFCHLILHFNLPDFINSDPLKERSVLHLGDQFFLEEPYWQSFRQEHIKKIDITDLKNFNALIASINNYELPYNQIYFSQGIFSQDALRLLKSAVTSGCCSAGLLLNFAVYKGESLDSREYVPIRHIAVAFAEALMSGQCPQGFKIALPLNSLVTVLDKLGEALMSGQCPSGLEIDLSQPDPHEIQNDVAHAFIKTLAKALTSRQCPPGLRINLNYKKGRSRADTQDKESLDALIAALVSGECPPGLILCVGDLFAGQTQILIDTIKNAVASKQLPQGSYYDERTNTIVLGTANLRYIHDYLEGMKASQAPVLIALIHAALHNDRFWQTSTPDSSIPAHIIAMRNYLDSSTETHSPYGQLVALQKMAENSLHEQSLSNTSDSSSTFCKLLLQPTKHALVHFGAIRHATAIELLPLIEQLLLNEAYWKNLSAPQNEEAVITRLRQCLQTAPQHASPTQKLDALINIIDHQQPPPPSSGLKLFFSKKPPTPPIEVTNFCKTIKNKDREQLQTFAAKQASTIAYKSALF